MGVGWAGGGGGERAVKRTHLTVGLLLLTIISVNNIELWIIEYYYFLV